MKTVGQCLEQYQQICKDLLIILNSEPDGYTDEKFSSVEAAVEMRQKLLDELGKMVIKDSDRALHTPALETIKKAEMEIESKVKIMMSELEDEHRAIQDQRHELNTQRKVTRSYVGTTKSAEGYFIDKKK